MAQSKETQSFGPPTPCIMCEKALAYLELGEDKVKFEDCINNANNFKIIGGYGSSFDGFVYEAVVCDDCMDKLIQRGKVQVISYME